MMLLSVRKFRDLARFDSAIRQRCRGLCARPFVPRKSLYRKVFFGVFCLFCGEVTERPKVHDWKSCVLKGTEGSNPSLSASFILLNSAPKGFEAERTLPVA